VNSTSIARVRAKLGNPAVTELLLPPDGRLSADGTLRLTVNGNQPVNVTVTKAATDDNEDLNALAADVNDALKAAGLGGTLVAGPRGRSLPLTSRPTASVDSLQVNFASATDPFVTAVGYTDGQSAVRQESSLFVQDASLTASASLTLQKDPQAT